MCAALVAGDTAASAPPLCPSVPAFDDHVAQLRAHPAPLELLARLEAAVRTARDAGGEPWAAVVAPGGNAAPAAPALAVGAALLHADAIEGPALVRLLEALGAGPFTALVANLGPRLSLERLVRINATRELPNACYLAVARAVLPYPPPPPSAYLRRVAAVCRLGGPAWAGMVHNVVHFLDDRLPAALGPEDREAWGTLLRYGSRAVRLRALCSLGRPASGPARGPRGVTATRTARSA